MHNPIDNFLGNLDAAFRHVRGDAVVVCEDDDWYSRDYLMRYSTLLLSHDLVGQAGAVYYNLMSGRYWPCNNRRHASLCQTAMRSTHIPYVLESIAFLRGRRKAYLDLHLWRNLPANSPKLLRGNLLSVGMKGFPGKKGIGVGHQDDRGTLDVKHMMLRKLVENDADTYIDMQASWFLENISEIAVNGGRCADINN